MISGEDERNDYYDDTEEFEEDYSLEDAIENSEDIDDLELINDADLSFDEIPPALFALLGEELDAVLARTGYNRGQSYPANDLWLRESKTISTDVLNTFLEYARRLQLTNLLQKLESVLGSPNLH